MDFSLSQQWILHVDMDAFFAAVEEGDHPEYKNQPLIVGADPENGRGRGVVSTCNYTARKYGIHSAMPVSRAFRLCPQGIFLKPRMGRYLDVSKTIKKIFTDFSPVVESVSIDEAFLDISGMQKLFVSPVDLAYRLKDRIKEETGLTASAGISKIKFIAKMASDLNKPDGLAVCIPGKEREFIAHLPVGKLWGVGKKTEQILKEMGIHTVGDLSRTDDEIIRFRLKEHGLHLKKLSMGIDARKVETWSPRKSISEETTFHDDTDEFQKIVKTLKILSDRISRRMLDENLSGCTVSLKIRLKNFQTFTRSKTFSRGIHLSSDLFQTAESHFNDFDRNNQKIRLIGIAVSNLKIRSDINQKDLFTDQHDEKTENIEKVFKNINEKFGSKIKKGIYY
ncbi:MAG: DNA polymerase IV [Spirochaetia bacterium]|nr:DNA polymerase IV [Spirochaetia bacterium]